MHKILIFLSLGLGLLFGGAFASSEHHLVRVKLTDLPEHQLRFDFYFDGPLQGAPHIFTTETPQRLIIDFQTMKLAVALEDRLKKINLGVLEQYQLISSADRVRILMNLNRSTHYTTHQDTQHFQIILSGTQEDIPEPSKPMEVTKRPILTKFSISNLQFRGIQQQTGRLILDVSQTSVPVNVVQNGKTVQLTFLSTAIPQSLIKRFDVTDFHTPAQMISTQQNGSKSIIKIKTHGAFGFFAYQVKKQFMVDFFPLNPQEAEAQKLKKQIFTGKRISLNFQDISIRSVLQLLADFTHTNMVVSDSVNGNMTLRLEDVPWDQALNIIMSTRGLDKRQMGNVMLIAPKSELVAREKQEFDATEELKESTPVRSEIMAIQYAKADDLASLISNKNNSLLSKRGVVNVDARTNSIWIQDIDAKIEEVRRLIQKLDVPVKQVLIETRIVDVTKDVAVDLGIKWGITRPDHLSGTLAGANQIAGGTQPANVKPLSDRLNVDLGAAPVIGNPASVGIALASLGANILLDLELSALESEDKAEVIASPRVVTSDQQEAYISSGEQIPYQQATSSGATAVSFVQAVLGLRVTPQVTPDGRILMKLKINQDRASEKLFNGVPAIITKEIDTNVLVDNGETIVLGGIFQRDQANNVTRVPFFGNIPGLGVLFKQTSTKRKDEELIIFITPKIITDALAINAVDGQKAGDVYK